MTFFWMYVITGVVVFAGQRNAWHYDQSRHVIPQTASSSSVIASQALVAVFWFLIIGIYLKNAIMEGKK